MQLTYSVKLMNPETEAGVYGEYDADGSRGYEGLFTNSRADLYPVSSDGAAGSAEQFAKPTVSYEVKAAPEEPAEPAAPADKPDAEVPSDRTAQTGDDMKIAAIVTLMLAAAAGGRVFHAPTSITYSIHRLSVDECIIYPYGVFVNAGSC